MVKKFAALMAEGWTKFFANPNPVCPHCGREIDISEHELHQLYQDGEHAVSCPYCSERFNVKTETHTTFSTDEQD